MTAPPPDCLPPPAINCPVVYRADEDITEAEDRQLRELLFACFSYNPIFLARRYLQRRPGHRWLLKDGAGKIIAHAAVHEKTIGTEAGDLRVGGVAEVCVGPAHRGLGHSKKLLLAIDQWLEGRGIEYAMLFGRPRVYRSSGYVPIANQLRTSSLWSRSWNPFHGKPMVKARTPTAWPSGTIDLRGPTF